MTPVATPEQRPGTEAGEVRDDGAERSEQEQAVIAASKGRADLTEEQVASGTEWFLSEQPERPTILAFDLNVAAAGLPARWIRWQVRALTRTEIRDIREEATDEATGRTDDMVVNMRVVIAASVDPDLREIATQRKLADPADLVNQRFAHKPGLVEVIASKANEMSGYGNTANLIRPVDAAGN